MTLGSFLIITPPIIVVLWFWSLLYDDISPPGSVERVLDHREILDIAISVSVIAIFVLNSNNI